MTIIRGIIFLLLATLISWILSVTVDMSHYELGALINIFWPLVSGLGTMLFFVFTSWIFSQKKIRIGILIILCSYLIYIGIALHFEKDYWPLVLW